MARRSHDTETNNDGVQDSFLDIVANIVGILILLVIIVGIRAAMQPQLIEEAQEQETAPLITNAMVEQRKSVVLQQAREVDQLRKTVVSAIAEAKQRDDNRINLATHIAAVEAELQREKAKLDKADAERLRVRSELAEADYQWQQLMLQKVALAAKTEQDSEKLFNTPTPLASNHTAQSIHLRLRNGRVAVVPLEQLAELVRNRSSNSIRRDLERQEGVARVGPIDGFVLDYAIILSNPVEGPMGLRAADMVEVSEVLPLVENVGEPVATALNQGTRLDSLLDRSNPRDWVIKLWVYPDSTSQYRSLQDALRKRGFAIDLRPLQEGKQMIFSSQGRETGAQ